VRQRYDRTGSENPLSWGVAGGCGRGFVPKDPAGNRIAEQIDDATTAASYNNMNQLVSQQAGGALVFKGTVSEPANVTIAGKPAVVTPNASQPPSQDFQGAVPVPAGGQVQVTATDPSGNTRTSTYQVATGTPKAFTYDLNGNMTSDGTRTCEWDAENRLVAIKEGANTIAGYTYNGDGIRTSKTIPGKTITYVIDGTSVVEERLNTGGVTKHFQALGIDNVLAMEDGAAVVTCLTRDQIGSIREHVSAAGTMTLRLDYDPWGNPSAGAGTGGWAFTARENDAETELYCYRARYYAASTGRFISADPIGLEGGPNLYSYVGNNPVVRTDPTGLKVDLNYFIKGYDIQDGVDAWEVAENLPRAYGAGYYVGAHGNTTQVRDDKKRLLNAKQLAKELKDRICKKGVTACRPVVLLACYAGQASLAQELANELKVRVTAPNGYIQWIKSTGLTGTYYYIERFPGVKLVPSDPQQ
jgi:RHS repeat-associated protein